MTTFKSRDGTSKWVFDSVPTLLQHDDEQRLSAAKELCSKQLGYLCGLKKNWRPGGTDRRLQVPQSWMVRLSTSSVPILII